MAASGEPYSVAARGLAAAPPDGGTETIREVIARAEATLAAPSARIEWRIDTDVTYPERPRRPRPGPVARLAAAAWKRVASGADVADLRDAFRHQHGEGFLEPAAGRYQVDYRAYAQLRRRQALRRAVRLTAGAPAPGRPLARRA
jgi:hypothetical protein